MRRLQLSGTVLAALSASAYTQAGHAQDCNTLITDVQGQLQQEDISPQLQREIEQQLSQARDAQDCEAIVAEAEQRLDQARDLAEARADDRALPSFEEADDDENGQLDEMELATIEQISLSSADTNGDGSLSHDEYEQARGTVSFQFADEDSDGELSRIEVATLDDVDFDTADSDQSGALSRSEFMQAR